MRKQISIKYYVFRLNRFKDPESYAKLYEIYVNQIYRFILFKVSEPEVAQDLTSEVFLKVWAYVDKGKKQIDNFNAFIYQVARNCVTNYFREKAKKSQVIDDEKIIEAILYERHKNDDQVLLKYDIAHMRKGLENLKEEYKEVIILKFIEGYSSREIAEILDKKSTNIRVMIHRGLKILRELLVQDDDQENDNQ